MRKSAVSEIPNFQRVTQVKMVTTLRREETTKREKGKGSSKWGVEDSYILVFLYFPTLKGAFFLKFSGSVGRHEPNYSLRVA